MLDDGFKNEQTNPVIFGDSDKPSYVYDLPKDNKPFHLMFG